MAAFVYLLFLVWLVVFGPGRLSLDALVARRLERGDGAGRDRAAAAAPRP